MSEQTSEKKKRGPIGVHIDQELWKNFRMLAFKRGITATSLLEEIMKKEIEKQEE